MKTPEEIKIGLECSSNCSDQGMKCRECPYQPLDCPDLHADALAYIQQLETDKEQLEGLLHHMNQLRDAAAGRALQMEERVHQLEAKLPRWIPVEERLPEKDADDNVLVIVNGKHRGTLFEDAYMMANFYPGEGWIIEGYEEWEKPEVSYWMPLPHAPKEE